jgi:hypothetical protein
LNFKYGSPLERAKYLATPTVESQPSTVLGHIAPGSTHSVRPTQRIFFGLRHRVATPASPYVKGRGSTQISVDVFWADAVPILVNVSPSAFRLFNSDDLGTEGRQCFAQQVLKSVHGYFPFKLKC